MMEREPGRKLNGFSTDDGFFVQGVRSFEEVDSAAREALRRLRGGEKGLAVHRNCGTTIVAANLLAAVFFLAALGLGLYLGWPLYLMIVGSVVLALVLRVPLSLVLQRFVTTDSDLSNAEVGWVERANPADLKGGIVGFLLAIVHRQGARLPHRPRGRRDHPRRRRGGQVEGSLRLQCVSQPQNRVPWQSTSRRPPRLTLATYRGNSERSDLRVAGPALLRGELGRTGATWHQRHGTRDGTSRVEQGVIAAPRPPLLSRLLDGTRLLNRTRCLDGALDGARGLDRTRLLNTDLGLDAGRLSPRGDPDPESDDRCEDECGDPENPLSA